MKIYRTNKNCKRATIWTSDDTGRLLCTSSIVINLPACSVKGDYREALSEALRGYGIRVTAKQLEAREKA